MKTSRREECSRMVMRAVAALGLFMAAQAWATTSLRGSFNGWGTSDLTVDSSFGGGVYSWLTVQNISGSPAEYKFYSSDGSLWLGVGTVAAPNSSVGVADKNGGGNLTLYANSSKKYTFRIKGYDTWWQRNYVVMETDAAPVGFASITDNHALNSGTGTVTVTVNTSATPSPQETVYVRWTKDNFATTTIAAASGSGTAYTATIPAQSAHAKVTYYVFTSTMPSGVIAADTDLCTLRGNSNGGANYSYTAGGGQSWHIPASSEPPTVTMRAPATYANTDETVYLFNGTFATGFDQTGGSLYYRRKGDAAWSTQSLVYDQQSGNNKYWKATFAANTYAAGDEIEYYWKIMYSNCEDTWLGSPDGGVSGATYLREQDAQAHTFSYAYYSAAAALSISADGGSTWQNADYTTSKFFINERANESADVIVRCSLSSVNVKSVEVFSNLGRRDYADVDYTNAYIAADGYADGICPPNGNLISTNDTGAYFAAFPMTAAGGGVYVWTGRVSRCGAYRLTARYKTTSQSGTNWYWYGDTGLRDHAVVVSPAKAHALTLYELNPLTVNATAATQAGRSTFASLTDPNNGKFNLNHLDFLQANCLWFQPIHPNAITSRGNPSGFTPGSPYATRDYFAVSPWLGAAATEESALSEFTNFVAQCDRHTGTLGTINVLLDGVFNHTSWDARFGQGGVDLGLCSGKDDLIGQTKPGWYSLVTDYGEPATYYTSASDNDFATAPDRGDFGKWADVADLYFGNYAALVRHNPENNGDYLSEADWYDHAGMRTDTKDLWKYFAYYADYWLAKTGHPCTNGVDATKDDLGIDGLRCDFGQGLPPQFWEYFINHTRSKKWNFIFMAETLDGGNPGRRSNRQFDILNESVVFKFTQEHISQTSQFKQAYEDRRTAYKGGEILLNLTSHDEVMPESDPWMTASRYGCNAMIDGLPMIFYGQEKGIVPASSTTGGTNQGFEQFELNFGKYIVHFKQWNKATFWESAPAFSTGLDQWYGRVNWARLNSPALRSVNRYFLSRKSVGGDNPKILAAAKYGAYGVGPTNGNDVVLAFALILDSSHTAASETYDLQGPWAALGLSTNKLYNVQNLASGNAASYLWPLPKTGQELYDSGIWVNLAADSGGAITRNGALVQYLRIVETGPHSASVGLRIMVL